MMSYSSFKAPNVANGSNGIETRLEILIKEGITVLGMI